MSPIPFHGITDDPPGAAGFLRFLPHVADDFWLGAMLMIDAAGEPVEFTYARVQAPSPTLWRPEDFFLTCVRSLAAAIFDACPVAPLVIVCRADEVDSRLFSEQIQVETPIVLISQEPPPEDSELDGDILLQWTIEQDENSPARRLINIIAVRGLLLEPFERAEIGLREVYPDLFEP